VARYWKDMRPTALRGADAKLNVPNANTGRLKACGEKAMFIARTVVAMKPSAVLNAMNGLTVYTLTTGYSL